MERTAHILELSQWSSWPDDGGWAAQDAYLIDDVLTYLALRRRVRWEVEHHMSPSAADESAIGDRFRQDDGYEPKTVRFK